MKRVLAILLALILAVSMTGCKGTGDGKAHEKAGQAGSSKQEGQEGTEDSQADGRKKEEDHKEEDHTESKDHRKENEKPSDDDVVGEDNPDLALIFSDRGNNMEAFADFAEKYKGRIIEFKASLDKIDGHDLYVTYGDYNMDRQLGPTFKIEDEKQISIEETANIMVKARVLTYDYDNDLFYLGFVDMKER